MKAYVSVYRKLLTKALKATWFHRGLWFFGFFAGLVQTGAVTNDVLRLAPLIHSSEALTWKSLNAWWENFDWGKNFVASLFTASTQEATLALVCIVGIVFGLILLVTTSQHILLMSAHRAAANKKPLHWRDISMEVRTLHVGRLLSINVIGKLALVLVLLGGGYLAQRVIAAVPEADTFAVIGMYMIVLPLAFTVSAVAMMSLVHITRDDEGIFPALRDSVVFVRKHWLATVEYAALLFLVNFAFTGLLMVGLVFVAQIMMLIVAAGITGATTITVVFYMLAALMLLFIAAISGCMTTFNYCAWNGFVEKFTKSPAHPRTEHAAKWLRKAFVR